MAKTYEQIQRQIEQLQAEAERLRREEVGEVIGRIRQAIDHYGLTAADLGFGNAARKSRTKAMATKSPRKRAKAAKAAPSVQYRDDQGRTWAGRGKRPQWLRDALAAGRTLDEFRVAASG